MTVGWPSLVAGARVHLISPAGPVRAERVAAAVDALTAIGFRATVGDHALQHRGYLAGTDDERLTDLHESLADPDIGAVMATRGGFGTQRLLDRLDRDLLARSRALFVG